MLIFAAHRNSPYRISVRATGVWLQVTGPKYKIIDQVRLPVVQLGVEFLRERFELLVSSKRHVMTFRVFRKDRPR